MTITRIFHAGFETGNDYEWDDEQGMAAVVDEVMTGTYSSWCRGAAQYGRANIPATKQIRSGFFHRYHGGGNSNKRFVAMTDIGGYLVSIRYDTNSNVYLYVGGVQKDIAVGMNINFVWQHWGIDIKIDAASGWAKVYRNGIEVMSFTGNTGTGDIEQVRYGRVDGGGGYDYLYFDDVYVDDTTGEGAAAVCPIARFYPLTLDGNGNYNDFVGSDGNSTDNYLLVDEVPASTADYVETNAADEYDSYTMTGITLDAGQTISAVIPVACTKKAGSTEQIALGTRLSSTDVVGSDQVPPNVYGVGSCMNERQTTKPGGGSWAEADVNGAELVIKSRGSY